MTYFDKLLELMNGDAKEAAKLTFTNCPRDFFNGGTAMYGSQCNGPQFENCYNCWFSEVEEKR